MGYRAGLHILAPEEPSSQRDLERLILTGIAMGLVFIGGTLVGVAIQLAKDLGDEVVDALVEAWTGERS